MGRLTKWFFVLLVGSIVITGCSSSSSSSSSGSDYSYNGPGSSYSLSMKAGGTFELDENESSMELSGSWTTLASGFKKLTVSSSNKPGTVAVGDAAYVLDIPGVVTLLKPLTGTQIISMVQAGSCPTADFSANWIRTDKDINIATQEVFGKFNYTSSSKSATLPFGKLLTSVNAFTNNTFASFDCSGGIVDITGSDTNATMYLTTNSSAIVRTGGDDGLKGNADDGLIVGLPSGKINTKASLNDDYVGLLFTFDGGTEEVNPLSLELSNGSGVAYEVTSVDNNTKASTGTTITLKDVDTITHTGDSSTTSSDGFVSATATSSSNGTGNLQCAANVNVASSGKNFIFCVGQNPDDNTKAFTALFVSK